MKCPHCGGTITKRTLAKVMGQSRSEAKQSAARNNGKLGGRPRTKKTEPDPAAPAGS